MRFSTLNEAAHQVLISDQSQTSLTMMWTDYTKQIAGRAD